MSNLSISPARSLTTTVSQPLMVTEFVPMHNVPACYSDSSLVPIESSSIGRSYARWSDGFTTPSTVAPEPSPTIDSALPGKGLCYNDPNLTWAFEDSPVSWVYNWATQPGGLVPAAFEYVPMLWGTGSIESWFSDATNAINAGSGHLLSFNEPDLPEQANIPPEEAARAHVLSMSPFVGRVRIGSPAVSNGVHPNRTIGLVWLESFLTKCKAENCTIDFVAFHWYNDASQIDAFEQHVRNVVHLTQSYGIEKVWLTEFGVFGSDEEVLLFLSSALEILGSIEAVERYAYFMCSDGILLNGGAISSLGNVYIGQG